MTDTNEGGDGIRACVDRFMQTFNDGDLEAMLACLAEGALYCEIEGAEHRGKSAIRRAFAPQFAGELGKIRFDVTEVVVDPDARKAAVTWICRMDVRGEHGSNVPLHMRLLLSLVYGGRFGFRGVDVLHFDDEGKVTAKLAHSKAGRPLLKRELGAAG